MLCEGVWGRSGALSDVVVTHGKVLRARRVSPHPLPVCTLYLELGEVIGYCVYLRFFLLMTLRFFLYE